MDWVRGCLYGVVFFFFQAEDGIRDWSVTGVQTCALPIWAQRQPDRAARAEGTTYPRGAQSPAGDHGHASRHCLHAATQAEIGRASCRKECRSRWSPDHEKKNKRQTRNDEKDRDMTHQTDA